MLILWTPAFLGIKNASIQPLSVSFISLGIVSPSHSTIISNSPSPDRLTSTENNSNIYIMLSVFCVVTLILVSYMAWILFRMKFSIPFMVSVNIWTFQRTVYPVFSWWSIFWNLSSQKIKHAQKFSLIVYMLQWKTAHANLKKIKSSFRKICNTQKNSDTICVLYFLHYLLWSLMLSSIMALSGLSTLILLVS